MGTLAGSLPLTGAFSGLSFDIVLLSLTRLIFSLNKTFSVRQRK